MFIVAAVGYTWLVAETERRAGTEGTRHAQSEASLERGQTGGGHETDSDRRSQEERPGITEQVCTCTHLLQYGRTVVSKCWLSCSITNYKASLSRIPLYSPMAVAVQCKFVRVFTRSNTEEVCWCIQLLKYRQRVDLYHYKTGLSRVFACSIRPI